MKINTYLYGFVIALLLIGIANNVVQNEKTLPAPPTVPVFIEMFTSKNCPSCPGAEVILSKLALSDNVIPITCHVSYWDYETNKDPFSREFCEVRQHGYADTANSKIIFTPQMIINGEYSVVGDRVGEIRNAFTKATEKPPLAIGLHMGANKELLIDLPAMPNRKMHLWAFGFGKKTDMGKNHKTTNPALSLDNLGSWDGHSETIQMQILNESVDGMMVIAQENGYGAILAAGRLDLR